MQPITSFSGDYRWLSNFWPSVVKFGEVEYPSVENAYQAAKTLDVEVRKNFEYIGPGVAKRLGKTLALRPEWDDIKLSVMATLLRQKFSQPEFKTKLLATGDAELIEGNHWGDTFWGVCDGCGHNHLGQILMNLRREFQNERD